VLSLPLVTMPAAWAALVRLSHLSQTSPSTDLHDFWDAFKENLGRGMIIAIISALILLINLSNLYSYREATGLLVWLMRGVWLATILTWFSLQIYLWVLFYEMEKPNLRIAFRNAFIMLLRHPFFTLGLWLGMLILAIVSSFLPVAWLLLTVSFFATLSATASLHHLAKIKDKQPILTKPKP
jgi:uncharacterized membrane protein YesL